MSLVERDNEIMSGGIMLHRISDGPNAEVRYGAKSDGMSIVAVHIDVNEQATLYGVIPPSQLAGGRFQAVNADHAVKPLEVELRLAHEEGVRWQHKFEDRDYDASQLQGQLQKQRTQTDYYRKWAKRFCYLSAAALVGLFVQGVTTL